MSRITVLLLLVAVQAHLCAGGDLISSMDQLRFGVPKEKGRAELVDGREGKAVKFSFDAGNQSTFFTSNIHGTTNWDQAAGFSLWVKGDGSNHLAGLQFIYDDDYALRYDYAFPVRGSEWTKVIIAWEDLIPVLPRPNANLLHPAGPNKPSKLSALWLGKWWYWGEYPAQTLTIDEIRLEPVIARDTNSYLPSGSPLDRVWAKLEAGAPVTIVTMGDSLTDFRHWANRQVAWPNLLRDRLREKFKSEVRIVNPAIGGTLLRQNLVLMPRWLAEAPEPDLVTICFGGNDWESGMRGDLFREACLEAINRIRRATKGKTDLLLLTTVPNVKQWQTHAELGEACRRAARQGNAGLADTERAFWATGRDDPTRLFAWDGGHLSPVGHELVVTTILQAIEPRPSAE